MITWIIYFIVGLILCFILYLASQGISRGLEAKSDNKKDEKFCHYCANSSKRICAKNCAADSKSSVKKN